VDRIKQSLERELKLEGGPEFRLTDLPGEAFEPRAFTSTYYDTEEHRLARLGVTLRRRVEGRRSLWQAKIPHGNARLELEVRGGATIPKQLTQLLFGVTQGGALATVGRLRTERTGVRVLDGERVLAEVSQDAVAVLDGANGSGEFIEIEVELVDGDDDDLRTLAKAAERAGARRTDGKPKIFRVLGLDQEADAPTPLAPELRWIQNFVREQRRELLLNDAGARLGGRPEHVHKMRVATRRLRAFLRAASASLDEAWADKLGTELSWLADALGSVRDLDVLLERLADARLELAEDDQAGLASILETLERSRDEAHDTLVAALGSRRYVRLLRRLEEVETSPAVRGGGDPPEKLARREFQKLQRAVAALGDVSDDDALHRARIKAKRARYAAELAGDALGGAGSRFVERAKAFQDLVGEHQDALVAEERLRALASSTDPEAAFVAGRLAELQRARRAAAKAGVPKAWKRLEKVGLKAL